MNGLSVHQTFDEDPDHFNATKREFGTGLDGTVDIRRSSRWVRRMRGRRWRSCGGCSLNMKIERRRILQGLPGGKRFMNWQTINKALIAAAMALLATHPLRAQSRTPEMTQANDEALMSHYNILADFWANRVPVYSQWINNTGSPIYIKSVNPTVVWVPPLSDFFLVLIRVSPSLGPLIVLTGDLNRSRPQTLIDLKSLVHDFVQLNPGDGLFLQTSASALQSHLTEVIRIDYTVGSP
jgi:hypothetical protein